MIIIKTHARPLKASKRRLATFAGSRTQIRSSLGGGEKKKRLYVRVANSLTIIIIIKKQTHPQQKRRAEDIWEE